MNKYLLTGLFVGVVLVFFILGGSLGIMYSGAPKCPKETEEVLKIISSPLVSGVSAVGEISKINGNNVTLSFLKREITLTLQENTRMYDISTGKKTDINLSNLKIGDAVSVIFILKPDGSIQVSSVMKISPLEIKPI